MPRKPELSAGLMGPRGPNADFTLFFCKLFCLQFNMPSLREKNLRCYGQIQIARHFEPTPTQQAIGGAFFKNFFQNEPDAAILKRT